MKGSVFAAAAIVGSALADGNMHRRHDALHNKRAVGAPAPDASSTPSSMPGGPAEETCGCTTKVITVWGSPTLVPIPEATSTSTTPVEETTTSTSTVHSTSTSTKTLTVTPSASSVAPTSVVPTTSTVYVSLPTNGVTSFSTTGTYTVPATTLTVTDSTTVCGATTTAVPSGTHTVGGVTTVVETDTVITCPYATVKPTGTTETSVIEYTTYTCPAAGTYTVVPGTVTTVPSSTVIVYPTPSTLTPGTYTKPQTVITATRTDTQYYCPFSEETSTSSPVAVAPTTAPAPVTTTAAPTSTSTAAPAATTSASSSGPGSGLTGEGQYGMTFSPYTQTGACMTKDEVSKNLKIIKNKGFNLVRIYSTDCSGLEFVGEAAKSLGMKMIVGVFIDGSGISKAQEQVDAISKWAQWGLVELIVVGNEAISSGYVDAGKLAGFISSSASSFKAAGYSGQVTTTEPINIWQASGKSSLCSAVDIVGANIHPFFNAQTTAEEAGTFALSEYKILKNICGKEVLNLETGWPNAGSANGAAVPNVANQQTAVKAIAKTIGSHSIFFSYADDSWKPAGEFGVEKHWGCASVF